MGHIALYREWRPKTFDEIVEQTYTVAALKQSVITGNIAHAYLFSGTRGTGKTTMAQVFSRAINCLSPVDGNPCNQCDVCLGILSSSILDVIEMDAASNNNVDTIRRLCDEVVFSPSVARYKVYIIDEVHMLSTGAFNALLKTLEEPPAHAVFILATTEPHRIPATILSRCQRYEFRRIPVASIVSRLRKIADSHSIEITDDALKSIAQLSDGALRDAISLLDQANTSFSEKICKEDILSLVGVVNDEFMYNMVTAIADHSPGRGLTLVEQLILDGRDIVKFTSDLALYFRNVMICQVVDNPSSLIYFPDQTISEMKSVAQNFSLESIISIIKDLSSLIPDLRWSSNPRITFEIALIRMMDIHSSVKAPVHVDPFVVSTPNTKKIAPTTVENIPPAVVENIPPAVVENIPPAVVEKVVLPDTEPTAPVQNKAIELDSVWPKILDNVISSGYMTIYLFLLPANASLNDQTLLITFKDKDLLNYNELSDDKNISILSDAVFACLGYRLNLSIQLDSKKVKPVNTPPDSTQTDTARPTGMDALKQSAEELGITYHTEE